MLPIVGHVGESEEGTARRHWTTSLLSPGWTCYCSPCLMSATEMYCNVEGPCVTALAMSEPLLAH